MTSSDQVPLRTSRSWLVLASVRSATARAAAGAQVEGQVGACHRRPWRGGYRAGEYPDMATDSNRRRAAAVTGGAAGIGLATCREFLCRGMAVAIVDRDAEAARKTAEELRSSMADATQKVVPAPADVRDSAAVDAAIASAVKEMGGLDVLVNCAGITDRAPAAEMTDASWSRMLDVHHVRAHSGAAGPRSRSAARIPPLRRSSTCLVGRPPTWGSRCAPPIARPRAASRR